MAKDRKPPLLDRLITRISPKWALERDRARAALARSGGYVGGAYSQRFASWTPGVRDADGDITYDLREMRGRSRDLARNAPIARGAVGTMVTYVVGTGLSVQSRIDAELLGLSDDEASAKQKEFERYFNTWAASQFADANQRQNFYEKQDLAERSELESGDVFALLVKSKAPASIWPYRLAVQMVEADRICNKDKAMDTDAMTQGIVRRNGIPYSVMIADRHPGRVIGIDRVKWTEVPFYSPAGRRNVLHLMHMERPDQTRGVPWLGSGGQVQGLGQNLVRIQRLTTGIRHGFQFERRARQLCPSGAPFCADAACARRIGPGPFTRIPHRRGQGLGPPRLARHCL
jgi:capsid protein